MGLTSEPDWLAGLIAMEPFGTVKERNFKRLMGTKPETSTQAAHDTRNCRWVLSQGSLKANGSAPPERLADGTKNPN